jgi:hypothetical protein
MGHGGMSAKSPVRALVDDRRAVLLERLEGIRQAERSEGAVTNVARDVALTRDEMTFLLSVLRALVDDQAARL